MTSNKVAAPKTFDREALRDKTKGIVPKNGQLSLLLFHSEIHIENQGIEMGILESGIPYLSQRGLVKITDKVIVAVVNPSNLVSIKLLTDNSFVELGNIGGYKNFIYINKKASTGKDGAEKQLAFC